MSRTGAPTSITLSISFDDEREAENTARALKVDDDEFVETVLEGRVVKGIVKADSIEGARRAADDWLACLNAIVKGKED
jgi:hypothetical protein